jgi:hypothetical protein
MNIPHSRDYCIARPPCRIHMRGSNLTANLTHVYISHPHPQGMCVCDYSCGYVYWIYAVLAIACMHAFLTLFICMYVCVRIYIYIYIYIYTAYVTVMDILVVPAPCPSTNAMCHLTCIPKLTLNCAGSELRIGCCAGPM